MQFSIALIATFAALSMAAPSGAPLITKRQAQTVVFTEKVAYNDLSISAGKAGDAEAEALAKLTKDGAIDVNDLSKVAEEDIDFWSAVNSVCNDAETGVFNPAIEAASGDEKTFLQNGKIKNKVLKLQATMLKLLAQEAQGLKNVTIKKAAETKKLAKNIALDVEAKGQESTALPFEGST